MENQLRFQEQIIEQMPQNISLAFILSHSVLIALCCWIFYKFSRVNRQNKWLKSKVMEQSDEKIEFMNNLDKLEKRLVAFERLSQKNNVMDESDEKIEFMNNLDKLEKRLVAIEKLS